MQPRFSHGADEHIFVEFDEAMSLDACFAALALCDAVRQAELRGMTEICPANASALFRFDPDVLHPRDAMAQITALAHHSQNADKKLTTRIVDVPVYYNDPWTHENLMRFRDRHHDPDATDLEYSARVNGFDSIDGLIERHAATPWFVSMVGFIAGEPFMFQMADRAQQIETPKYLKPRSDSPPLSVVHGGCFSCIMPVRSPGGYQMFGISPVPIYDATRSVSFLRENPILFAPGDIVKFRPIDREEYDDTVAAVEAGTFSLTEKTVTFDLDEFHLDSAEYSARLTEMLS